jgi:hypothetical protein
MNTDKLEKVEGTAEKELEISDNVVKKLGFWIRWGDVVLMFIYAIMLLSIPFWHYDMVNPWAWVLYALCILLWLLTPIWFIRKRKALSIRRVTCSLLALCLLAFFVLPVVIEKVSPMAHESFEIHGRVTCDGNLRAIDWAIIQYELDHGAGVYPTTIEEMVPKYFKFAPEECPFGGAYYLDTSQTPPCFICPNGHTY